MVFANCVLVACIGLIMLCGGAQLLSLKAQQRNADSALNIQEILGFHTQKIAGEEFALCLVHFKEDELEKLASNWLDITQKYIRAAADINIAISKAPESDRPQLRTRLEEALTQRSRMLRKLGVILEEWAAKGGKLDKTAPYKSYMPMPLLPVRLCRSGVLL